MHSLLFVINKEGKKLEQLVKKKDGTLYVKVPAEVDHCFSDEMRDLIDRTLQTEEIKVLEFDFAATEFMDSSGIGVLLNRYKQMEGSRGTVTVYGVGPRIGRILKIGGIHRLIRQYRNKEDAVHGVE